VVPRDRRTGSYRPIAPDLFRGVPARSKGNLARRGPHASGHYGDENLDRTEKRDFVTGLAADLSGVSMVVVTQNLGLTVAEATDLRRRMRASGSTFRVAKNRLAHLAVQGTRFEGLTPMLKGPTALAWSTDPVAVAKTAVEFAKTNEKLVLIGGALGTQTLNADGIKALAELPSLETLRGRLLGMLQTPATRLAGVLQAPAGQLARVFGAYAKRDEEAQAA